MRAVRSPIDEYVVELRQHLRGPWLARRSILRELRDGLADAADAYQTAGATRAIAERRAIAELGNPADVATAFREELTASTGRHTAWLLLGFSALTLVVANLTWHRGTPDLAGVDITSGYSVLAQAVDLLAVATLFGAVLAVAAFGWAAKWATRWVGSVRATRMVGWLVLGTSSGKMLGGTILWLWAPETVHMTAIGLAISAIILLSTAWLALSAARCVSLASACHA